MERYVRLFTEKREELLDWSAFSEKFNLQSFIRTYENGGRHKQLEEISKMSHTYKRVYKKPPLSKQDFLEIATLVNAKNKGMYIERRSLFKEDRPYEDMNGRGGFVSTEYNNLRLADMGYLKKSDVKEFYSKSLEIAEMYLAFATSKSTLDKIKGSKMKEASYNLKYIEGALLSLPNIRKLYKMFNSPTFFTEYE